MLKRKLCMMSLVVAVGLGGVAMVGCGKKGGVGGAKMAPAKGSATPSEAIKGVIDAMGAGDAAAAASYFPSDEVLAGAIDCGPEGRIIADVVKARDGMKKDADEMKGEGVTLKFLSAGASGAPKSIAKGETMDGCTAKVDITVVEYTFKFEMTKGDKKREREKTKPIAQFGESGWYVMED